MDVKPTAALPRNCHKVWSYHTSRHLSVTDKLPDRNAIYQLVIGYEFFIFHVLARLANSVYILPLRLIEYSTEMHYTVRYDTVRYIRDD